MRLPRPCSLSAPALLVPRRAQLLLRRPGRSTPSTRKSFPWGSAQNCCATRPGRSSCRQRVSIDKPVRSPRQRLAATARPPHRLPAQCPRADRRESRAGRKRPPSWPESAQGRRSPRVCAGRLARVIAVPLAMPSWSPRRCRRSGQSWRADHRRRPHRWCLWCRQRQPAWWPH